MFLSTHSPYVLDELPPEARILLIPGPAGTSVVSGVSTEFAMTRIDDLVHPEVYVFVEDKEASILLREILASSEETSTYLPRLEITPVGPVNVVQLLGKIAQEGRLPYRSLSIVDGGERTDTEFIAQTGRMSLNVLELGPVYCFKLLRTQCLSQIIINGTYLLEMPRARVLRVSGRSSRVNGPGL